MEDVDGIEYILMDLCCDERSPRVLSAYIDMAFTSEYRHLRGHVTMCLELWCDKKLVYVSDKVPLFIADEDTKPQNSRFGQT